MANRTASTLNFCGRDSELETLKTRWQLACNVEDPSPQVVVIKAERGLGKTRLALEFYKWLRENEDGWLTKSYWPDGVDIVDRNLDVNPDPGKCRLSDVPIPYLWWGLRAADVGAENGVAADAVATYDRFLAPHLAALLLKSEMVHHGWSLAKAMASVGIDFATSALMIDKFVSVGKGIFRTAEILLGAANKQTLNEAMERSFSRADSVLEDLRREFKPGTLTCAKLPGVILIDDAQFIHEDPALPSFVERLLYRSVVERWPLLILVTHWRAELSPELAESASSFTAILKHAREGLETDLSPAYCLPGGYLSADHFTEIDLKPILDLSQALRTKLPGLTPEQATAILADMGGNPRFLEQVIAFLLEHEGLFESFDTSRNLTPEGLEETLNETRHREIFTIVLRRLRKAPEDVQEAICLASVQGMRFANDFVDQIAQDVLGHPVREPLGKGEEPYSMLIGTKSDSQQTVGEFAERLFHQVAQQHRQSLKSLGGEKALRRALETRAKALVRASDPRTTTYPEALGLVCGIAANLFEHSTEDEDLLVAGRAISIMAYLEVLRHSGESAAALYERLLALPEVHRDTLLDYVGQHQERVTIMERLAEIYRILGWPAKSARTLHRVYLSVVDYLPGDLRLHFLDSGDKAAASGAFDLWKREHSGEHAAVLEALYIWSAKRIVNVFLGLSELARALPDLKIAQGDDALQDKMFIIAVGDHDAESETTLRDNAPQLELRALALAQLAYAKDGVIGDCEAEKEHCRLLERLAQVAIDRQQYSAAEEYLQRGLKINEVAGDQIFQLSALNNLIVTFGKNGDIEKAGKYLELAAPIVNAYIQAPTFPVDLIMEESSDGSPVVVDRVRITDDKSHAPSSPGTIGTRRWTRRVHIPVTFSREFDADPDSVIRRNRDMMGTIAFVFENAGQRALSKGEPAKAKQNFQSALSIRQEVRDPEGAFRDLNRLNQIAFTTGERAEVCENLKGILELAPVLRQIDPNRWQNIEQETRDALRKNGCVDTSTPF